jgi:hypothetical protein
MGSLNITPLLHQQSGGFNSFGDVTGITDVASPK